jgi:hypothetical protein
MKKFSFKFKMMPLMKRKKSNQRTPRTSNKLMRCLLSLKLNYNLPTPNSLILELKSIF